jgi:hypothetical protein
MGSSAVSHHTNRQAVPFFGLRRRPGRLALAVFRLPLRLYRQGRGWLLGDTFLLLVHAGRKTGKRYSTVAMVLRHDPRTREAVICSAWGQDADWVQIGRDSFTPGQRFLSADESVAVMAGFRRRHPYRTRLLAAVLNLGDLRSDAAVRDFAGTRPFVSLRPLDAGQQLAGGEKHD